MNDTPNATSGANTAAVIDQFNQAFLRKDAALLDGLIADHCVIEAIEPLPDGARYEGGERCLAMWRGVATDPSSAFELEGTDVMGERAVIRWRNRFGSGEADSIRGVNLMRVHDGQVVEAMGYVKSGATVDASTAIS